MSDETKHPLAGRCGTCARFTREFDTIDPSGKPRRAGECLLGAWSPPIYEDRTCSQYLARGTVRAKLQAERRAAPARARQARGGPVRHPGAGSVTSPIPFELPEELLDMNADEFRSVLRDVLREELGVSEVEMAGRFQGGDLILHPGKEGTADKKVPIEVFFRKVIGLRDKLRLLEQKVNSHPKLTQEDKVQLQQYVTQCYGALTTFNLLFADREDGFVGQSSDD